MTHLRKMMLEELQGRNFLFRRPRSCSQKSASRNAFRICGPRVTEDGFVMASSSAPMVRKNSVRLQNQQDTGGVRNKVT